MIRINIMQCIRFMLYTLLLIVITDAYKKPVLKFGGSSLANVKKMKNVCNIVGKVIKDEKEIPIIVLSAIGDTTNKLLAAGELALLDDGYNNAINIIDGIKSDHYNIFNYAKNHSNNNLNINKKNFEDESDRLKELIDYNIFNIKRIINGISTLDEFSPMVKDLLCSHGEMLSTRLFCYFINNLYFYEKEIEAKQFDSWEIGLQTYGNYGDSKFKEDEIEKLKICFKVDKLLENNKIPVVTGFICKNDKGRITTLGRGGSDLTATFLASCCKSKEIQIWKDVDGLMTADPKIVKTAKPISKLSYLQASELAYFGAKILHPVSMLPASRSNIPVLIKNLYDINSKGTYISNETNDNNNLVLAITAKKNITLIEICSSRMLEQAGFLSKVFKIFEEEDISIDVIATSEISISLTLDSKNKISNRVVSRLKQVANVRVKDDYSIISLICNTEESTDVINIIFKVLSKYNVKVDMISQGASKVNISIIVKSIDINKTISLIHNEFY